MRIAVIGGGISGNLAARLLSEDHQVTLFEANSYAGGHTHSVTVEVGGQSFCVDTGFMVFNRRTYPNFCLLLQKLGIAPQVSDMSFSVRCDHSGLEYQGSSLNGIFSQRGNLFRPRFLGMLKDILRFNHVAQQADMAGELDDGRTVGQFLDSCRLGSHFRSHYLVPMAAAIWSARPETILDLPAKFLIGFCRNHGLLQLRDRPQWLTIPGGAQRYVAALLKPLGDRLRLHTPVRTVTRHTDYVALHTHGGEVAEFDRVVFACHADQALSLIADPSPDEVDILGAFPYQANMGILHTDTRCLPRSRRAWASWNYAIPASTQPSVSVTYDLSRLQQHRSSVPILLTLNPAFAIDAGQVLRTLHYRHPAFSRC